MKMMLNVFLNFYLLELLKNQKGKKNRKKRIKRNASEEEISSNNDKVSDSEEALDGD